MAFPRFPAIFGAAVAGAMIVSMTAAGAGEYRHHRYDRDYHDYDTGAVVDAPYAHVETGDRVVVDAPFAHVYSGRHGQHIVAPFVDLWVPRADD
jgi:hypothetical protein